MKDTVFIRLLHHEDKEKVLTERISALRQGESGEDIYAVAPDSFQQVPNSPFCYWVSDRIRRLFKELPPFESEGRTVKQGLATADDFRFVRAWWEVPPERILDGGGWEGFSNSWNVDEPKKPEWTQEKVQEFQKYCLQRTYQGKRWVPFAKGGEYSPYYSDIHLVVNWGNNGEEIRNFCDPKTGRTFSRPQNTDYYFRPGLTYTSYTNLGFAPRILQAGAVFSVAGMGIHGVPKHTLAFLNAEAIQLFLYLIADRRKWEAGVIQRLPVPRKNEGVDELSTASFDLWKFKRTLNRKDTTSHAFLVPSLSQTNGASLAERAAAWAAKELETRTRIACVQADIDEVVFNLYGFTEDERRMSVVGGSGVSDDEPVVDVLANEETDLDTAHTDGCSSIADFLGWCVGVAFGRFDVRPALDLSLVPGEPDPFDPLPVCPPGMLVGPDGLPAEPDNIVSEEWLRARPDANTLPPEGSVTKPTITDSEYPLRIFWDGILVDDPGLNGAQPHREDIVRRVREVLDLLWKDKAHEIEQEACEILGVSELRDYFRKPSGFFQDHLKRYSKSRRKAPIYWPLSTASGSYTVWAYYPRLTDQTLYTVVNKFVEPKIDEVERGVGRIENEKQSASGREAVRLNDLLKEFRSLLSELKDFREELLRIAELPYKPDLNDGVIINAAPFHNLFRLRSWAKDTEACWRKLEKGGYDWSHLAYTIWPDRVKKVCRKDRSIPLAHGLEDVCEAAPPSSKKKRTKRNRRGGGGKG